jgi:hypothetical protein
MNIEKLNREFEEIQTKHINLKKFIFLLPSKFVYRGFFNRTTLKEAMLISNIITLLYATSCLAFCFEKLKFMYFFGYLLPSLTLGAGSVLLLLSMENLDNIKSRYGYILSAISFYLYVVFIPLMMLFSLFYQKEIFLSSLIWNIINLGFQSLILFYLIWMNYNYAKRIDEGQYELVESGSREYISEGPVLDSKENDQGPQTAARNKEFEGNSTKKDFLESEN